MHITSVTRTFEVYDKETHSFETYIVKARISSPPEDFDHMAMKIQIVKSINSVNFFKVQNLALVIHADLKLMYERCKVWVEVTDHSGRIFEINDER